MAARRAPRRYILLGVGLGVLALAVAGGTWLALATNLFQEIGPGVMVRTEPGGPLVTYSGPGRPAQAVLWTPVEKKTLSVQEVERTYTRDDPRQGIMRFRVLEDATGQRWLSAVTGSPSLTPSPDRSRYFFYDFHQLYLLDARTLEVSPLTSLEYQGKSRLQWALERHPQQLCWVASALWAEDGRVVLFTTDRAGQPELWQVDVATRHESMLVPCRENRWILVSWVEGGWLFVRDPRGVYGESAFLLVDPYTGQYEQVLYGFNCDVSGPYVWYTKTAEGSEGLLFDANRRVSVSLPPPPEGYDYCFPYSMSPDGARMALYLSTREGKRLVGVMDVSASPATLRTYPVAGGGAGGLMWLDDETVAIHSGDKTDPNCATYALKVGGAR